MPRRFTFELSPASQIPLQVQQRLTLGPKDGVFVAVKRRKGRQV